MIFTKKKWTYICYNAIFTYGILFDLCDYFYFGFQFYVCFIFNAWNITVLSWIHVAKAIFISTCFDQVRHLSIYYIPSSESALIHYILTRWDSKCKLRLYRSEGLSKPIVKRLYCPQIWNIKFSIACVLHVIKTRLWNNDIIIHKSLDILNCTLENIIY